MGKTTEFIKGAGDSNGDDSINKSISRRDFLKLGLLAGASIAGGALLAGCNNANAVGGLQKPTDIDRTPTDNPMGQNDGGNEIPQGETPTETPSAGNETLRTELEGVPITPEQAQLLEKYPGVENRLAYRIRIDRNNGWTVDSIYIDEQKRLAGVWSIDPQTGKKTSMNVDWA